MISLLLSIVVLILGYFVYGRFVERVFGPDDRVTPAISKADGGDYVVLPSWKVFMIQFLNIAGTGPIFGAIMGAKFGPAAYLWIVFGCIFAGATHDYLSGMLSLRNGGVGLPELIGKYLGKFSRQLMLVFSIFLLIMVGSVFVYSPAEILQRLGGTSSMWIVIIFVYYVIATMLPIDKLIGKIYPFFAFSILFMAVGMLVMLLIKMPVVPELWDGLGNMALSHDNSELFPALFITIACGAISGFHATQSPLMARCMKSEHLGRPVFYGSMITEGFVALIWATVSSWFFYGSPTPGYELLGVETGYQTSAPSVVFQVCSSWLGVVGGILALIGVVAAPITSGDTAFRSARLIVADFLHLSQTAIRQRLMVSAPLFAMAILMLFWQIDNPNGFNVIWQYFGWANQTLSVFTLWMLTMWLSRKRGFYYIVTLIPAMFMTMVCTTFIFVSKQSLHLDYTLGCLLGAFLTLGLTLLFFVARRKVTKE